MIRARLWVCAGEREAPEWRSKLKAPSEPLQTSISAEEAGRLRELLKRREATVTEDRREHHRYDFEGDLLVASLQEPGAPGPAAHVVFARNISGRGIGFFHHGKVRPGTRCVIRLQAADGQRHEIAGWTVHCTVVEDMVHEIGVRTTIDVDERFLPPGGFLCPDVQK